jgi:hypothetical protein
MTDPDILPDRGFAPERRAKALIEALPYIQRFHDAIVVVKFGGNAMTDPALAGTFAEDMVLLRSVGLRPVVVHGGGPQIGALLARLGKETEFVDGLRVTDEETLDIARMVLVGKVGREIVGSINVQLGDELIASRDLVTLSAVAEAGFFGRSWDGMKLWMNGFFKDEDEE